MEKVIPQQINYADLKPESIEHTVKLVRFTPTASVNQLQPNDTVKFMLQNQGFLDPYSTYIKFTVEVDDLPVPSFADTLNGHANIQQAQIANNTYPGTATPIRTLPGLNAKVVDRSAHSFIQRMLIRSQATELERIEQYDVIAAMINDTLYSHEQRQAHCAEGFPQHSTSTNRELEQAAMLLNSHHVIGSTGMIGEPMFYTATREFFGEVGTAAATRPRTARNYYDAAHASCFNIYNRHRQKLRSGIYVDEMVGGDLDNDADPVLVAPRRNERRKTFCIPIYSGIIGVLMPDKKLIPLSLMPLEIEFQLNPFALYTMGNVTDRAYRITNFEIYGHVLMFEQEVHRSLESVVAEHGIFMHFNSFYLAPVTQTGTNSNVGQYAQVNVLNKSMNSLHFCFIYSGFENKPARKKLNFASHNLKELQVRNGVDLYPSEKIRGNSGSIDGTETYHQFLMETNKAWNRMHDPTSDSALRSVNFCLDYPMYHEQGPAGIALIGVGDNDQPIPWLDAYDNPAAQNSNRNDFGAQVFQGRCQYGVSFEGATLGADKTMFGGKKAQLPFDINYRGDKRFTGVNSYLFAFVRSDYVLYVRPDLVVTVLGR